MISNYKIINIIDESINQQIEKLIVEFQSTTNFNFPSRHQFEFHVPSDFDLEFYNLTNELSKSNIRKFGKPRHNAITILPEDENYSKFIILFRKELFDDFEYFSTVIHELTHLADFLNYFADNGNVYKGNPAYDEFYFWTEFNAKKNGIKRMIVELEKQGLSISLEIATEQFISEMEETNSFNKKIYLLMHFFARLSIFDENKNLNFNKNIFPKDYLFSVFGEEIIELYKALVAMVNYSQFKRRRNVMSLVLDRIQD